MPETLAGLTRFARYAYPPNALGYCGPDDHAAVFEYASSGEIDPGLIDLARGFEGAFPYLTLIAGAAGRTDPFDPEVVEAYWVGNELLDGFDTLELGNSLDARFRSRAGGQWGVVTEALEQRAVPHHNFHVLCVYPWVGLLRSGDSTQPLLVLDRCRIRVGTVEAVGGDTAMVSSRPLQWDGVQLSLGQPRVEEARSAAGGVSLVGELRTGDRVAVHWDWICDRLRDVDVDQIGRQTSYSLAIANRSLIRRPLAAAPG